MRRLIREILELSPDQLAIRAVEALPDHRRLVARMLIADVRDDVVAVGHLPPMARAGCLVPRPRHLAEDGGRGRQPGVDAGEGSVATTAHHDGTRLVRGPNRHEEIGVVGQRPAAADPLRQGPEPLRPREPDEAGETLQGKTGVGMSKTHRAGALERPVGSDLDPEGDDVAADPAAWASRSLARPARARRRSGG